MKQTILALAFVCLASPAFAQYGPQSSIPCPANATQIVAGQNIATVINAGSAGQAFCVGAGTYAPTAEIRPKANMKIVGQVGAAINGASVTPNADAPSTSIIRLWNCSADCSGVLIQNLVIYGLASYNCIGITGNSTNHSDGPTVDHTEIYGCTTGITNAHNTGGTFTYNYIHGNVCHGGGEAGINALWDHNDISGTSDHSCKFADNYASGYASNVKVTNSYFHDLATNVSAIWFDTLGTGNVINGNTIIGATTWFPIDVEATTGAAITNNDITPSDSVYAAIYIPNSANITISGNTIHSAGGGGTEVFYNTAFTTFTPANIYVNNNTYILGSNTLKIGFQCTGLTSGQCQTYWVTTNNGLFDYNSYQLIDTTAAYWSTGGGGLTFAQWNSAGMDTHQGGGGPPAPDPPPPPPPATPPSLTITSPTAGAFVTRRSTVSIVSSVTVNTNPISRVNTYVNGNQICSNATVYTCAWKVPNAPNKTYSIYSVAIDTQGFTGQSSTITVKTPR